MTMLKLLLVEDDDVLGFIIKEGMELIGGYEVHWASNPEEGLKEFDTFCPDIIVSDIEMPGMTGLDFVRKIREFNPDVPIILETCVTSSKIILEAYNIGIDNYIKKPFLPEELHAYIQGLMKRIGNDTSVPEKKDINVIKLGKIELNLNKQVLITPEGEINITTREAKLLELLYDNLNEMVTKEKIADEIWGGVKYYTQQRLDSFIYTLRKYLSSDKNVQIRTMRGIGYMLTVNQ